MQAFITLLEAKPARCMRPRRGVDVMADGIMLCMSPVDTASCLLSAYYNNLLIYAYFYCHRGYARVLICYGFLLNVHLVSKRNVNDTNLCNPGRDQTRSSD